MKVVVQSSTFMDIDYSLELIADLTQSTQDQEH
jgi:hypothetical protein